MAAPFTAAPIKLFDSFVLAAIFLEEPSPDLFEQHLAHPVLSRELG